ncbi:MAG: polysaccharide deacetylase family protein, partial [Planctomycetes bacterium]|nr:polysaccharide deacetylase family protein [Planctomycetota bacterium]
MQSLLPIYMYHQVAPESAPGYEPYLYVTPSELEKQVAQLTGWGLKLVTLAEAWEAIADGKGTGGMAVLTFDDLFHSFIKHALPVLEKHGAKATAFAIGNSLVGKEVKNVAGEPEPATLADMEKLEEAGIEIGSHGMSHEVMTSLSPAQLEEELAASRKTVEDITGREVKTLCYPRGIISPRVEAAAEKAGYACACSTLRGNMHTPEERFRLKRIRSHGGREGMKLWYTTTRFYEWMNRKRYGKTLA